MLHIERKPGQAIRVNDDLRIVVTQTSSGSVHLAFDGPKSVKVYREEVYDRQRAEASTKKNP